VINDLFQEIFLFITQDNYRKLRSFSARNGCKFSSWLHQVVVHRVLDFTRSHKPLVSLDAQNEEGDSLLETIKDERALANDLAIEQEKLRELADCINLLNNEDKYFLRLYLGRDLSPQELMVALRASRGAVDMRKARILGRLRDCFASKGYPC
jgi:RNA polymerase sigma factor (sigma-70 family)